MAVTTETRLQRAATTLAAGLVAGIVMGAVLHVATPLLPTIGAIAGVETVVGGWGVHLGLSVAFAAGFVALLSTTHVTDEVETAVDTAMLGVAYGGLLGLVSWGVVIPAGLASGGAAFPLAAVPDATASAGLGIALGAAHVGYGLALGLVVGLRHQPSPELEVARFRV